ncbi:MAG: CaiB/BaiF CoA-transferase family protein [Pseudomonadota bacterium]
MLEGIQVVEFEGLGPAPFAGMLLADLGADVIVINRPGPANPAIGEHNLLDRGKRSIVLNLKSEKDIQIAKVLANNADALIEGLRPGVMERLGLGPREFEQSNPKLVYGRMTGWGQTGPRAHTAGHDFNYLATSGALWYASVPGDIPQSPPTMLGDIGGGAMYLVAGILAALLSANKTGKGAIVDAAIVDGSAHMMALLMAMAPAGNLSETRGQSLLDGGPWGRMYRCKDGGYLSVQCLEPQFYELFLSCLGLEDDSRFEEQYDRDLWPNQTIILEDLFANEPVAHWAELFEDSDACVAEVLSPSRAANDPHIQARDTWHKTEGFLQPAPAPRFDGMAAHLNSIPKRGAHKDEIIGDLKKRGLL